MKTDANSTTIDANTIDFVQDILVQVIKTSELLPLKTTSLLVVLVITRTNSTTPYPIITRQDVIASAGIAMLHHINHMIHARPFGLLCPEAYLHMLGSASKPSSSACVNLAYTCAMWM